MRALLIALFVIAETILVLHAVKPKFVRENRVLDKIINQYGLTTAIGILGALIIGFGFALLNLQTELLNLQVGILGNQREMITLLQQILAK